MINKVPLTSYYPILLANHFHSPSINFNHKTLKNGEISSKTKNVSHFCFVSPIWAKNEPLKTVISFLFLQTNSNPFQIRRQAGRTERLCLLYAVQETADDECRPPGDALRLSPESCPFSRIMDCIFEYFPPFLCQNSCLFPVVFVFFHSSLIRVSFIWFHCSCDHHSLKFLILFLDPG